MTTKSLILLVCLTLQGCAVSQKELVRVIQELDSQNMDGGREVTLAQGERSFDFSKDFVIKAFLTTFGQFNMAVVNLDNEMGYILGEGAAPLAPGELERIGREQVALLNEMTQGYNPWAYVGANNRVRATVNLFEKGDNYVTAKLTFSNEVTSRGVSNSDSIYPPFLEAYYAAIWDELDKQLFILQGTIDN